MFSRLMSITNHLYWLITTYTGPPTFVIFMLNNRQSSRGKKVSVYTVAAVYSDID